MTTNDPNVELEALVVPFLREQVGKLQAQVQALWIEARTAQYRADEFEYFLRQIAAMDLDDTEDAAANNMRDMARAILGIEVTL
jgi:hypothetical protein